ncbi:50S ribosomal protein L33 [Sporolactobacillus pectinivorans]
MFSPERFAQSGSYAASKSTSREIERFEMNKFCKNCNAYTLHCKTK